jgi:hypothetical protein
MVNEGGRNWYQSINFDKLVCWKVFFFGPKGTPSQEEHKTSGSVLPIFSVALTNWCRKIQQNVSPYELRTLRIRVTKRDEVNNFQAK